MAAARTRATGSPADLAIYLVAFFVGWIAIVALVWRPGPPAPLLGVGVKAAWWLAAAALYLAWLRRNGIVARPPMQFLGFRAPSWRVVGIGLAVAVALLAKDWLRIAVLSGRDLAWPDLLTLIRRLDAPLIEETVFTGLVFGRLRLLLAPPGAIAATSLLFLAIHFPGWLILSIPIDVVKIVSVALVGVLCETLRLWTGSLWPSLAAHWVNNIGAEL